jgi:hypothetical protein
MEKINQSDKISSDNLLRKSKYLIKKIVIGKLKELYFKAWKTELFNDDRREGNQNNKLRTYRLFKQNFNFEPYSNILTCHFKQHQALTKLRIGNHRLEIELGRHKNIKAADQICKICKDGVEDETHFLVKCKNFENIRKPYLETIYTVCPNLKTYNNENIFIWIMGCENPEALRTLSNLIIELTSERDLYLKNI